MVDIAAGGAHSACITASGELFTWGKGRYGRLGHGDSEDQLKPKLVRFDVNHAMLLFPPKFGPFLLHICIGMRVFQTFWSFKVPSWAVT